MCCWSFRSCPLGGSCSSRDSSQALERVREAVRITWHKQQNNVLGFRFRFNLIANAFLKRVQFAACKAGYAFCLVLK